MIIFHENVVKTNGKSIIEVVNLSLWQTILELIYLPIIKIEFMFGMIFKAFKVIKFEH